MADRWQDRFFNWMREQGKSPATATAYLGRVSAIIHRLGREPDPDLFADYLEEMPTARKNNARSAWRAWVQYAASQGVTVAPPPTRGRGRPRLVAGPLDPLCHALVEAGIPEHLVARLAWSSVRPGRESAWITLPGLERTVEVPLALVHAIRDARYGPGKPVNLGEPLLAHPGGEPWTAGDVSRARLRVGHALRTGVVEPWRPPAAVVR